MRWAVAGSVAFHLALLGSLALRPERERPVRQPSGTLIFVEAPQVSLSPPAPEPHQPAPEPRAPPRRLAPSSSPRPADPRADAPLSDSPLRDDEPRSAPHLSLLVPGASFALRLDAGTPEVEGASEVQAPRSPQQVIDDLAKETLGQGRVERGLVHPYYGQLGKALLQQWDAERVAKAGLKGLGEQLAQNSKIYNEAWADRAAAYGRGGSPIDAEQLGSNRRPAANDRIQGLQGVDLEARKELGRQMASAFKAVRRATIRVVQDRSGKLLLVELVHPSNDSHVDQEALKDVRAAAEKLPAPPSEVVGTRERISSLWSFELIVSISPPMPVFTFEFDEALGFVDARLPLDRRIYKKVRLVSVE
jgi:hypothetical protein